jgi:ATP-dependent Clp protease, protease subunit
MQQPAPPKLPTVIYASLAGPVDQSMVQRLFQFMAIAINGGVKEVHAVFQSTGGMIGEGVALYNYFRSLPIDLRFYNVGSISSIAVIAYLGAKHRYASANATFVIHKSHFTPNAPTNADRMSGMTNMLKIEDARTRKIIESHLKLSKRRLERHLTTELPFTTQAALECGLITEIRDFSVPSGQMLSNI